MATFLSILIIIVCVLLVLIVLVQNPKGGGIASNFMSTSQFIGARQQVELIEQITWGFVGGLVVLCIAFAAIVGIGGNKVVTKESIVGKSEMPMPGSSAPNVPAQQQQGHAQQQQNPATQQQGNPVQQQPAPAPAPTQPSK